MKLLLAIVAAAALCVSPAVASTFLTETGPASDGSLSWDFGNNGGIPAGAFEDTFDIFLPASGLGAGSITATFTSRSTDLTFTAVSFDGFSFSLFDKPGSHDGALGPTSVPGGHHLIDVHGISPGTAADYAGTLSFTPTGVPEPASWALMILGFGLAGGALRSRRRGLNT